MLTVTVGAGCGFRTRELNLASTGTDSMSLPASQMAELYLQRWRVELFLDDIKTTLGMDVLKARSPAMIYRELLMHVIAYNLVRSLMLKQARSPE